MHYKIQDLEELIKMKQSTKQRRCEKEKPMFEQLLTDDTKAKFYTGLPNFALFNLLFDCIELKVRKMRYWYGVTNVISAKVPRHFRQ